MKLGDGLTTGVNVRLDATAPRGSPPVLHIGNHVQINDSVHIGAIEQVVIGDYTLIASRVFISDHNHGNYQIRDPASAPDTPPAERPLSSKPVHIGRNVWLGEQVCILPGVTVGNGAIVGANSVVTHDIPSNSIAAGNPARVIRLFDASTKTWKRI
jgi:lipopolysaccharide O-acetyltransferase